MEKTANRSCWYWQDKAQQFSDFYTAPLIPFSPFFIVARFLKDRTTYLLSLLPFPPIHRLLDLGCGSGPHIKLLSSFADHITGVDYSEHMLKLAKKNLEHQKRHNWRLIRSDAASLPMQNGSFDCIIAMGLLDYVSSPIRVLSECRRVITDNGTIIVSIPKKPSFFSLLRNPLGESIKEHVFHLPPIDNALTKSELLLLFQKACFRVTGIRSVWNAMWMVRAIPLKKSRK